jgi:aspartate aminotransferase
MISKKMVPFVEGSSVVRAMFEEGKRMAEEFGPENVFDFSVGNPSVPAPEEVKEAIIDIIQNDDPLYVHGYMSNAGFPETRAAVAGNLNRRFGTSFTENNIIMTVGAGSALNILLRTMLNEGEEVIVFAPYFLEYGNYIKTYGGVTVAVSPNPEGGFMPKLDEFEAKITPKTKAVIVNNPNNPTGAVYPEEIVKGIADILKKKQEEYGTVIYLLSDEPYRELAFGGVDVPYMTKYYDNTVVAYSYSKSLSLPGERIGYVVIPDESDGSEEFIQAVTVANRLGGFTNAPSLMQLVIARCVDAQCDVSYYEENAKALYGGLTALGFECTKPEGAFYLWMKSPVKNEKEFVAAAKKLNLLLVPGSSFAGPGYVRMAYCVSREKIMNSLPRFAELAKEYNLD